MKNKKQTIKLAFIGLLSLLTSLSFLSCAASTDPQGFGQKAETEVSKGMGDVTLNL